MTIDLENTLYVTKGEPMPFMCPECRKPVPYTPVERIECPHCGLVGNQEDFSDVQWELIRRIQ